MRFSILLSLIAFVFVDPICAQSTFCDSSLATYCLDFDSQLPDGETTFGNARIVAGIEITNGYLSITDSSNWNSGAVVFPPIAGSENVLIIGGRTGAANSNHHLDNLEMDAAGNDFTFSAELRMGGGTRHPADGLSFNFARPDDPVIDNGEQWAEIAAHRFPEEGTQTGLAIGFDEWNANEPWDIPGISVRYNDVVLTQFSYPTFNGKAEDATSLQTGPNQTELEPVVIDDSNKTQSINIGLEELSWEKLSITRSSDQVTIQYKGNTHSVTLPNNNLDCTGDRVVLSNDIACSEAMELPAVLDLVGLTVGDFDLDGEVAFADFLTLAANFEDPTKAGVYANGDADLNGVIEFADFLMLLANFDSTTTASMVVPEPCGAAYSATLLLGLFGFFRRRQIKPTTMRP